MSRIYFRCAPFDKGQVTLALESGVDGVIVPGETPALHVLQSGLNQSILQSFLDTYVQMHVAIAEVAAETPAYRCSL